MELQAGLPLLDSHPDAAQRCSSSRRIHPAPTCRYAASMPSSAASCATLQAACCACMAAMSASLSSPCARSRRRYWSSRRASSARAAPSTPSLLASTPAQRCAAAARPAASACGAVTPCGAVRGVCKGMAELQEQQAGSSRPSRLPSHSIRPTNCAPRLQAFPLQVDRSALVPAGLRLCRHLLPQRGLLGITRFAVGVSPLLCAAPHRLHLCCRGLVSGVHRLGALCCRCLPLAQLWGWGRRRRCAAGSWARR